MKISWFKDGMLEEEIEVVVLADTDDGFLFEAWRFPPPNSVGYTFKDEAGTALSISELDYEDRGQKRWFRFSAEYPE